MTFWKHGEKPTPEVTVIGTGTMGAALARCFLASGIDVSVWSRHWASMSPLVDRRASAYDEAWEAALEADMVISMLPTPEARADVMLDGLTLRAMRPGAIWVQMATIGVEATDRTARQAWVWRPDVVFVNAPLSGSRESAETGQLLFLASGPEQAARSLDPVFSVLGRVILWLGPAGAGSAMKLVLNNWLAFQTEGTAEAAALPERLGASTAALFAALGDNPPAALYALAELNRMVNHDYHPDLALDWALKDLDLVSSHAGTGVVPVAVAIADRWRQLVHDGSSGLDVSAAREGIGRAASADPTMPPAPDDRVLKGGKPSRRCPDQPAAGCDRWRHSSQQRLRESP